MRRVAVIGCGGAGKTTLSRELGRLLDLPRWMCLWGVARRRLEFRGRSDPDRGVYDSISWPFLRWVWSFRRRHRPRIVALLDGCSCDVVVLGRRRHVRRFLTALTQATHDARIAHVTALADTHF